MMLKSAFKNRMTKITIFMFILFSFFIFSFFQYLLFTKNTINLRKDDIRNRVLELSPIEEEKTYIENSHVLKHQYVYNNIFIQNGHDTLNITVLPLQVEETISKNEILSNMKQSTLTIKIGNETKTLKVKTTTLNQNYISEELYLELYPNEKQINYQVLVDKQENVEKVKQFYKENGYICFLSNTEGMDEWEQTKAIYQFLQFFIISMIIFLFFIMIHHLKHFFSIRKNQIIVMKCIGFTNLKTTIFYLNQFVILFLLSTIVSFIIFIILNSTHLIKEFNHYFFLENILFLIFYVISILLFSFILLYHYIKKQKLDL